MKRKRILLAGIFMIVLSITASAKSFPGYSYNSWKEAVETPEPYRFVRMITGQSMGIGKLVQPSDLCVSPKGEMYILDAPANKVVVLDQNLSFSREITGFTKDGMPSPLNGATGIFVDEQDQLLIADKGNQRAFLCNQKAEILKEYKKPESALFPADINFLPSKILKDSLSNVYVLVDGLYYGAVIYDANSDFQGFFGSNRVKITAGVLADYFWKKIMTDEQKGQLARYIPVSYTNMCIDHKNFIYTCTDDQIRKLNPGGNDVLRAKPSAFFGDASTVWEQGKPVKTMIADIHVEPTGLVNVLDATRGRVFQYDTDSNLLYAFGGIGTQAGTFKTPVAITSMQDKILVLDEKKCSITVFEPTPFGTAVRNAVALHSNGKYNQAMEPWEQVLKADANYEMAYIGIGKALYNLGDFKKSMEYFKAGQDRYNYSIAKKEYRKQAMGENFGMIASTVVFACIAAVILINRKMISERIRRRRRR